MLYFTTSWDDGDVLDLKLSQMLDRYNVKGTFYITQNYRGERLSEKEISHLALHHEVGAHTLTHPDLRRISKEEKKKEICGSKDWLEKILNKEVLMFCYPFGYYDSETDAFQMPTTLQVYPFPFRKKNDDTYYWRYLLQPWRERSGQLHELGLSYLSITSWGKAARKILELSASHDIVFHLWGHSWEIEKYGMWQELEELLKSVDSIEMRSYCTNGELLNLYNK